MHTVDDYIATLPTAQRLELERLRAIVQDAVQTVTQGTSYGMPAFMYKGKALLSVVVRTNHLSLYPFSGKVIEKLRDKLDGYSLSSGSGAIHFSEDHVLPEELVRDIIFARISEIEA